MSDLEDDIYDKIPLAQAMGMHVLESSPESVILEAPLAANINHIGTAFGGSESALAILAAWSLLHERLKPISLNAQIIIQRNSIQYLKPVSADFTAKAHLTNFADWQQFETILERRGRARINISATIECEGVVAARFEGDFIAAEVDSDA